MANILHLNTSQVLDKHLESMMVSLSHRLEVARAARNFHLVELLEQEKQQITVPVKHYEMARSHVARFRTFKQSILNLLIGSKNPQIREFVNGSDRWWYTFDLRTGNCVYADSPAELQVWIEENY